MDQPLVTIISVNYDQAGLTARMLGSLRLTTYWNKQVIVVDNASPTASVQEIRDEFPEVEFILSDTNRGFAAGNNLGIRYARGKYILLLNNDTEVDPGFLEPLVRKFETNPSAGAASPKIKFFHRPDIIQFSGITDFHPVTVRNRGIGHGQIDTGQFDEDAPTAFVHGAAMMVPMEVVRKTGLMAECFFLYYEEHDWATRIKKAGYTLWYVGNSLVMHRESASTGRDSPSKTYYMNRSRLTWLRRNTSGITFIIAIIYQLLVAVPKNSLQYLLMGKACHLRAYLRAWGWHINRFNDKTLHTNPVLTENSRPE